MSIPLVTVKNVSQTFKLGAEEIHVLKDVEFTLNDDSFNIVYGPSGSGKSTLLNILTGLQKPTTGSVNFGGDNPYELKPNELARFRANKIGFMYQQNFWVKGLNVLENISLPLHFLGYNRKKAYPIAIQSLERVGMGDYAKKYPLFLSGGEQQRIALARALVNDPLFIITDEPTGSLDSMNGDMIMDLLKKCRDESHRTIILVTHNMEYLPLADKLLHIHDGTLQNIDNDDVVKVTKDLMNDMTNRLSQLIAKQGVRRSREQG